MTTVRDATLDDVLSLIPLVTKYYEADARNLDLDESTITSYVIKLLGIDNSRVLVAEKDGRVIGAVGFSYGPDIVQELFWSVDDEFSGTKAGKKLMTAMEHCALGSGATQITVVAQAGPHATRVGNSYLSRGYAPMSSTYIKEL